MSRFQLAQLARVMFLCMAAVIAAKGVAERSWWLVLSGVGLVLLWLYFIVAAARREAE